MNIIVLAGGLSTERDVSLVSGSGITQALRKRGHHVIMLDVFLGYGEEGEDLVGTAALLHNLALEKEAERPGFYANCDSFPKVILRKSFALSRTQVAVRRDLNKRFFFPFFLKFY